MEITYKEEIKRKLVHLSSLWMAAFTMIMAQHRGLLCVIFAALLLLTLISEHDYANGGRYLGRLYGKLFGKMLRNEVSPGQWIVSGGAPVLAAALMVNVLFVPPVAASALAVMLTGDAFAALVGRRFGRHKLVNGKSLEGTLSFLVFGFAALCAVFFLSGDPERIFPAGAVAVVAAAAVELFQKQLKLDDNFTIPLTVGVTLRMFGISGVL